MRRFSASPRTIATASGAGPFPYVALFRHYNDDLDLGSYVIPGGAVTNDRLKQLYEDEIKRDPFIKRALGPRSEPLETVRIAPIRLGGEPRSSGRQFFAVGDAAGQTDPLTGEGIHTGMIGGKLAAETIRELLSSGELSASACAVYHKRWMRAFGNDFRASSVGARMISRLPLLLDAANVVAQAKGDAFMTTFGAAMTGVKPKTTFMMPAVAAPMVLEIARQVLRQTLRGRGNGDRAYTRQAVTPAFRTTSFARACLIDAHILECLNSLTPAQVQQVQ